MSRGWLVLSAVALVGLSAVKTEASGERRLLLPTGNAGKAAELQRSLSARGIRIVTLADLDGGQATRIKAISENRPTLAGNAKQKAVEAANISGLP